MTIEPPVCTRRAVHPNPAEHPPPTYVCHTASDWTIWPALGSPDGSTADCPYHPHSLWPPLGPSVAPPLPATRTHTPPTASVRALDDILESIDELKFYKAKLFMAG